MSKKEYTLPQFATALDNLGAELKGTALSRAALSGGYVIEAHAKLNASSGRPGLNVDTGNLVNSINTEIASKSNNEVVVDVGTGVEYARIHEYGGVIKPLHAKRLHFVIKGEHFSAMSVTIPARPYLRPAVDNNEEAILKAITTSIEKTIADKI